MCSRPATDHAEISSLQNTERPASLAAQYFEEICTQQRSIDTPIPECYNIYNALRHYSFIPYPG